MADERFLAQLWATIESRGTVGGSVYQREPSSPFSSAVSARNRTLRRGFSLARERAISSIVATPPALSTAPFMTWPSTTPRA